MSVEKQGDPLRDLEQSIAPILLGPEATQDDEAFAQYGQSLISVGLRNEMYVKYSNQNIFQNLHDTVIEEISTIGHDGHVVTVGCGTGQMEHAVAEKTRFIGTKITATDLFPHFGGYQLDAERRNLRQLEYRQADARELPFESNSVDLLLAAFVIYHIHGEKGGPEEAISEFHRVLKPGGKLIIPTRGSNTMRQFWQLQQPLAEELSRDNLLDYVPPETWYPNCDLTRTEWLLQRQFKNSRKTFEQISPDQQIMIPATEEGWNDTKQVLVAFKDNYRPEPPKIGSLHAALENKIKPIFMNVAAQNGGYFPLDVEQAVFEAIKIA